MAGNDSDLHEFIDAFLAYRRRPRALDQSGSSDTGDLLESIVRVDECMEVLETIWPSDTGFPDSPAGESCGNSVGSTGTSARRFGPYEILNQIGRGGMGRVFRARHVHLNRIVAIKILPPHRLDDPAMVARFRREMRVIGQLSHPNIVSAFDADVTDGIHYIAMEYVDGITLADMVRQSGPLPPGQAVEFMKQAADGLACAHRCGMIHRDVKPSNLMVTQVDGDQARIKLLDVGLARPGREKPLEPPLTQTDALVGTVGFIAPEQASNPAHADERSDIYSLGATLFYLLAGDAIPLTTRSCAGNSGQHEIPIEIPVPAELRSVLRRMVASSPDDRFASMADVIRALETIDFEGTAASEETQVRSRRSATGLARPLITAACVLVLLGLWYVLSSASTKSPGTPPAEQVWTSLSEGDKLNHWTPIGDGRWSLKDGVIVADGAGPGWLMLTAEHADAELRLEYRLPAGGTSGVYLRAWPDGALNGTDFLEIRLSDDNHTRFRTVSGDLRTGGLAGLSAPSPIVVSVPGTWHRLEVRVTRDLIEVIHDGTLVNRMNLEDFRRRSGEIESRLRGSGHFGLKMGKTPVEFRGVQLRPLTQ